jgi:hypothetical protein
MIPYPAFLLFPWFILSKPVIVIKYHIGYNQEKYRARPALP